MTKPEFKIEDLMVNPGEIEVFRVANASAGISGGMSFTGLVAAQQVSGGIEDKSRSV